MKRHRSSLHSRAKSWLPLAPIPAFLILASFGVAPATAADSSTKEPPSSAPLITQIDRSQPWQPLPYPSPKVIYGSDDRQDLYQVTDPLRRRLAAATCGLFFPGDVTDNGDGTYRIDTYAYRFNGDPPCSGEPFANQPTSAFCTGWLAGDDIVVTAGHCYSNADLLNTYFVFGFVMQSSSTPVLTVPAANVYRGVQVIARQPGSLNDEDYCIVRLDRVVTAADAQPLEIRRSGTVPVGTRIGVIGHPAGLPLKLAFGNQTSVRVNNNSIYFTANLDTYGGNSGSPVFNAATGVVEGILVRGAADYIDRGTCFVSNVLADSQAGEESTRTTLFQQFIPDLRGVFFEADYFACDGAVAVRVRDNGASGPISIGVVSETGDAETVALAGPVNNVWTGSIPIQGGAATPVSGDGMLQSNGDDRIVATYTAAGGAVFTDEAEIACDNSPIVEQVVWLGSKHDSISVGVTTAEPASVTLLARAIGSSQILSVTGSFETQHTLTLGGLQECRVYLYYIEAVDRAGNTEPWDNRGALPTEYTKRSRTILDDDFEPAAGGGWNAQKLAGNPTWSVVSTSFARSPMRAYRYSLPSSTIHDGRLISPSFAGGGILTFWHTYDFESSFDGAVLEISLNGQDWSDAGDAIVAGGYNGTISNLYQNPLSGRPAWTGGTLGAMSQVTVDLSAHAGASVRLGFRAATDTSIQSSGWYIDDLRAIEVIPCENSVSAPIWQNLE